MVPTLRRNHPARRTLGNMLAHLYTAGVPVRWDAVFDAARRVDIPGYAFADTRYWLRQVFSNTGNALAPSGALEPSLPASSVQGPEPRAAAGAQSSTADVRTDAIAMLARSLQISADDARSDSGFLELGVDSLALAEAVAALERRWSIAISRRALFEELGTPARLIDHIVSHTPNSAATSEASAAPATSRRSEERRVGKESGSTWRTRG